MARVLVTGGAGYVGSRLVPKVLSAGHSVRVLDWFLFSPPHLFESEKAHYGNRLELVVGDLRDFARVKNLLADCDTVIHLAGISNDPSSDLDPALTHEINCEASAELIHMARDRRILRFINASSSSVYGIKSEPDVTEDLKLEPLTAYSKSKVFIEDVLREERGDMPAISVRSATVCGWSPRMRLDLTVNLLTYHGVSRGKIRVFGGAQKRPNIHIEDLTDFYAKLVDCSPKFFDGRAYNVGAANSSVGELAAMVKRQVAPGAEIVFEATNDLRSYHISSKKVFQEMGFATRHSIAEAVFDVAGKIRTGELAEADQHHNVRWLRQHLKGEATGQKKSPLRPCEAGTQ